MSDRLGRAALARLSAGVAAPGYDPGGVGIGIVHIGVGAFHRAHQAAYTDTAIAVGGGDWRIDGISLRSTAIADALNPQDGLYTLLERGEAGVSARIVGSIARVIAASREPDEALAALCAPATRIVSLTVTEKAYGIDRAGRCIDPAHTAVAADLAAPRHPTGVMGMIVEGLRRRKEHGLAPVTVLCCDNLSDNGDVVRAGVLDFSGRLDPQLRDWIEREVAFPSTMVDRITPPSTPETLAEAERLTGFRDLAAVQTEPFSHWVIEDRFVVGRPDWEAGGAIFASSVAPYEQMKLRMLNGAHSLMAYAGFLSGYRYTRDVVQDAAMVRLVRRYLRAAQATLAPVPGIDLDEYAEALMQRFANPAIAHETKHIAMDGTEKLPQRSIACAAETLESGGDLRPFAFAIAAWMRFCAGRMEAGETYSLNDPRETTIAAKLASAGDDARSIVAALQSLPGMFPEPLKADEKWCGLVADALSRMQRDGMAGAVAAELTREG